MKKIFTLLTIAAGVAMMNAQIVINEVYGGGGNSGSTYKNDFVELINKGTTSVTLTGAFLQYGSAANAFTQYHALPDITLAPGQTYLIQEAAGAGGTTALTPDYVAPIPSSFNGGTNTTQGFNMAAAAFKIALTSNNTAVTSATDTNVLDLVGAGTSTTFEGSAPAPAPSNTLSINRTNGVDTNDNKTDFVTAAPSPKSSTLAVIEVNGKKVGFIKNTVTDSALLFGAKSDVKIYDMTGKMVKSASVKESASLDVSSLAKGVYIVAGEVDGQKVTQKFIKK